MEKRKIVIGLAGEIAAGKGTAAEYLKSRHKAEYLRFSDPGRDILKRLHKEISRQNMSDLNSHLRGLYGEGYLVDVLAGDIERSVSNLVVLDGVRKKEEVAKLRSDSGYKFIFVYITADSMVRYERLIKRAENSDDKKKSFENFKSDLRLETEKDILELRNVADFVLENSSNIESLHAQLDELLVELEADVDK